MIPRTHPAVRCLLVGCVLLAGCGGSTDPDDEDDELGHPPAAMVGTWHFQSATQNGSPVSLAVALDWNAGTVAARLHVEANGAYGYEEVDVSGGQIWAEGGWIFVDQEGGTIEAHIQWDSDGTASDEFDMDYTLAGGVLTLEIVDGGSTFVFTLGM